MSTDSSIHPRRPPASLPAPQPFDPRRRQFLRLAAALGLLGAAPALLPAYARPRPAAIQPARQPVPGPARYDLHLREEITHIAGARASAMTINHTIPGPLVALHEGHTATLHVHNHLAQDSSLHWHGILLPFQMDGVPGVVFPGIAPDSRFTAQFPVRQSGTYWYHSHSPLQEQVGLYGPLVIHPAEPEPFSYERDYVVMLTDWTFEDPFRLLAQLKKQSDFDNFQKRTLGDLFGDIAQAGLSRTLRDRLMWARMRMSPTDIADVTGHSYTYLMNGLHAAGNWTGLFRPGERVRLRLINGSSMSYFNVRIPGLPMTVVAADGPQVQPVTVDELQIAVAETYDVIVTPGEGRPYTIMAEAMDRSGYVRGTLAPRPGLEAPVPPLRPRPLRTMTDMGMPMSEGKPGDAAAEPGHGHGVGSLKEAAGPIVARHGPDRHGPGNLTVAEVQRNRLAEPGTGLEAVPHRVLTYADLRAPAPMADRRRPAREIELHLTGHMERYIWSFDGRKFSEVDQPIDIDYGERVRLVLVNDTMMEHPIHLHGMFFELENAQGEYLPRKHTVSVKPAERLTVRLTADEPGRWAFHCHLLYHMERGMFRVVRIRQSGGAA